MIIIILFVALMMSISLIKLQGDVIKDIKKEIEERDKERRLEGENK